VISISVGWDRSQKGYDEVTAAVERAKKQGIFVVSSVLDETYGYSFNGLGRDPLADPDKPSSYGAGLWWADSMLNDKSYERIKNKLKNSLLVPMDSRTTASPTGVSDYAFYRNGGWSWSIPYIAGLYALSCQAKPDITPEEFWNAALKTGDMITVEKDGRKYEIGKAANPARLIDELKKK
jgi:hypothetical protein